MKRTLSIDSRLETIRREAKRWLKALRDGDLDARRRLDAIVPAAPKEPGLRDVQFALAREYGYDGWNALRDALDDLALERATFAECVDIVVRSATWAGDRIGAARVLARRPEIRDADLYAAVVTGNLDRVRRCIAADPGAAARSGGPLEREPLLYLAYARLPGGDRHALDIARLLLDGGADPNARFRDAWDTPFTVLAGVIGEGEGDQPPHPQALEFAQLLFERGADPCDTQVLYDTSITRDDPRWLDILWRESERRGQVERWRTVGPSSGIGGKLKRSALDYLLGNAVAYNHLTRAHWLLEHGADPNGPHAYSTRPLRIEALVYGHLEMAALLERYGATVVALEGRSAFAVACLSLDVATARALVREDPSHLDDAGPMRIAARGGRTDVVELLLSLGMNVDVTDESGMRGIQEAVASGATDVVELLLAHGADVDRMTVHYGGALGFAAHFKRREIAELLAPRSRDVHALAKLAMTERLAQLLAETPELVNAPHARTGATPLFHLPDDEDGALEMATFLLARGADPALVDAAGKTATEAARERGLLDAADSIDEHRAARR